MESMRSLVSSTSELVWRMSWVAFAVYLCCSSTSNYQDLGGQYTMRVSTMAVRSNVISQLEQVAKEQNKRLAPLTDDLVLLNSGLDSLCLAIIVARLEDVLGIDPFSAAEDADFPVTVGDFIRFYEDATK